MITIVSAEKFRDLCDAVDYTRDSLVSCQARECVGEAERLATRMCELLSALPKRPTQELDAMQLRSLRNAADVMKRRAPAVWAAYEARV